jgi:hypothetical protein
MHRNQLSVDVGTVRELVGSQFPEWASLSVEEFASPGTVNALFRIGDRLAARFPLQPGAWHLLECGPRQALREDLASDDLEWARGMAWAFEQAMGLIWYYAYSNPTMSRMGQRTLARIVGSADL